MRLYGPGTRCGAARVVARQGHGIRGLVGPAIIRISLTDDPGRKRRSERSARANTESEAVVRPSSLMLSYPPHPLQPGLRRELGVVEQSEP